LFYDKVRDAFIETFNFSGLDFDLALRLFMDAFRPPGEGQKIDRIMQIFGRQYYLQAGQLSGLKSADAAYVLAFSVIMLNTDLHNSQNKKKMSPEDFARINDNTNDGDPMPQELLDRIYRAIAAKELKISSECGADELAGQLVYWEELEREASQSRNSILPIFTSNQAVDPSIEKDMFALVWGPTLAAVSVVLDGTSDAHVARRAVDGLLVAARLATQHGVMDVADQLLSTLSKYTAAFNVASLNPAIDLGNSEKAKAALEATFAIANLYGDMVHSGWRHVLDCIVRLHKADLLPPSVIAADGEGIEDARVRMPRPSANNANKSKGSSSGASLFSRAINSLISIEPSDSAITESSLARDRAARAAAIETAEACRVEYLVADSKFLIAESLVEFVKATMWAGGNVVVAARTGEGSDTAELALELLISLTLRNRDRVCLIWPLIHEYLAACISSETSEQPSAVAIRAVLGLFRVCQRVLPYKDDETAGMLIASLGLVVNMAPRIAWELADRIASEVLLLIKTGGRYIKTEHDWRTVLALLRIASMKPDAVPLVYESLSAACQDKYMVRAESYMPLLETCLQLIDRYKGGSDIKAAGRFLDCADALFVWLPTAGGAGRGEDEGEGEESTRVPVETMMEMWLTSIGVLARGLCREEVWQLRDTSVAALHRTLLASSSLNLPPEIWIQTTGELLVPLVEDLAKIGSNSRAAKTRPGIEKTVRLAVNMLTKVLLQYVPLIERDNDFFSVWSRALDSLQQCMLMRSEAVMESVPENTKNLLLVLATCGVLKPGWVDCQGRSLWDLTWSKASGISLTLSPALLSDILERREGTDVCNPNGMESNDSKDNYKEEGREPEPEMKSSKDNCAPASDLENGDQCSENGQETTPRDSQSLVEGQSVLGGSKEEQDVSKAASFNEEFHDAQEQNDQQQLQVSDKPETPACKQS
jgi:brefeldin A-resistance guanine nucleotide exchange factor 1